MTVKAIILVGMLVAMQLFADWFSEKFYHERALGNVIAILCWVLTAVILFYFA